MFPLLVVLFAGLPTVRARKAQANDEERGPAGPAAAGDQSGVALELSTAGFASGALVGGVFVGGRTASGLILVGFVDYGMTSLAVATTGPEQTTSAQLVRLGAGARHSFVQSADRLVDLYGAADASFEYRGAEVVATGGAPPPRRSAPLASRSRSAPTAGDSLIDASVTQIGFDGTFQLLGVF